MDGEIKDLHKKIDTKFETLSEKLEKSVIIPLARIELRVDELNSFKSKTDKRLDNAERELIDVTTGFVLCRDQHKNLSDAKKEKKKNYLILFLEWLPG